MNYPKDCDSPSRRTEYLYRAQELLRELHNTFEDWRDSGLYKDQYDRLPLKIRSRYPYTYMIDMDTWKKFHDEEFIPRSDMIGEEILKQRAAHKISTRWNIDVGEVEKFVRT